MNINDFPRQPCRCGHKFATLQAFRAHADLAEPLPHDHPADVGLTEVDGEWAIVVRKPVEATKPKRTAATTVRHAPNTSTDYTRTCKLCNATFERPRTRGRPPTKCPTCRGV